MAQVDTFIIVLLHPLWRKDINIVTKYDIVIWLRQTACANRVSVKTTRIYSRESTAFVLIIIIIFTILLLYWLYYFLLFCAPIFNYTGTGSSLPAERRQPVSYYLLLLGVWYLALIAIDYIIILLDQKGHANYYYYVCILYRWARRAVYCSVFGYKGNVLIINTGR